MTGFNSANRFNNLKLISNTKQPWIQGRGQAANLKSSPTPKRFQSWKQGGKKSHHLEKEVSFQPPAQSPVFKLATPVLPHQPVSQIQMCKCYCLGSWLTTTITLEKVLVPVTKPTGSTILSISQVSAQGNHIPCWQAPVRARHTLRCFVCSDYLRSRRFLHRRELKTFHNWAP